MSVCVVVESGPEAGTVFLLAAQDLETLGSGPGASWRLSGLEPLHLRFRYHRGVEVQALAPSFVGRRALTPQAWEPLDEGALLKVGAHGLRIEFATQSAAPGARRTTRLEPANVPPGYVVEGLLGSGGFGAVYAARHPASGRRVALKLMHPGGTKGNLARFAREAKTCLSLDHPHVIRAYAVDFESEAPFVAMELIDGPSLEDLVSVGTLDAAQAIQVGAQIAGALAYLESRKLVHRDVKPANILLAERGEHAKLADFGLVKDLEHELTSLTATGLAMGTLAFVSPEQLRDAKHVTIQADLYSLGVTLYRSLSGTLPYTLRGNRDLHRILNSPPTDLGTHRAGLPPELVELVHATLAKAPEDRPRPAELAGRLSALL